MSVKLNGELVSEINCDDFDEFGVCLDGVCYKYWFNGVLWVVKDFV